MPFMVFVSPVIFLAFYFMLGKFWKDLWHGWEWSRKHEGWVCFLQEHCLTWWTWWTQPAFIQQVDNTPLSSSCSGPLPSIVLGQTPTLHVAASLKDSLQESSSGLHILVYSECGLVCETISSEVRVGFFFVCLVRKEWGPACAQACLSLSWAN